MTHCCDLVKIVYSFFQPSTCDLASKVSPSQPTQSTTGDGSVYIGVGVSIGVLLVLVITAIIVIFVIIWLKRRKMNGHMNTTDNEAYQITSDQLTMKTNVAHVETRTSDYVAADLSYSCATEPILTSNTAYNAHTSSSTTAASGIDTSSNDAYYAVTSGESDGFMSQNDTA